MGLARQILEMGPRDERLPVLLDLLERWCDSDLDLAFVHEVRSGLEVRYLDALYGASSLLTDDLKRLWSLHEEITDVLGGELVARDQPASASRELSQTAEVARVLTARAVAVQADILSKDSMIDDWVEFEMARIEAGTGSFQAAIRILDRLLGRGVFPVESATLRARLALVKRYPEDARAAIERAAAVLPLVRLGDPFQEPLFALYREAGGNPDSLGLVEPPQSLVERAQANRDDLAVRALAGVDAKAEESAAAFWSQWRQKLDVILSGLLLGSDFDAAIYGNAPARDVRLSNADAAAVALDQLPGIPEDLRNCLLDAVTRPVPSRDIAAAFLNWLKSREATGRTFEELAMSFPGYGQSIAVALGRIEAALASGNSGAVVAMLDQYESRQGVPDRLLLEVWERTRDIVATGPRWLENVRRGRRIWTRLRGEAGRRCGELVRRDALEKLDDDSAQGAWEELCAAILDTMPDDATREKVWRWFEGRFKRAEPGTAMLRLGSMLARRIGPPFDAELRALVREVVTPAVGRLVDADRHEDIRENIDRLLEVTGSDIGIQKAVADWFLEWRPSNVDWMAAQATVGEWLSSRLTGDASQRVRHKTGQHLVGMLQASTAASSQVSVMERLSALQPDDPNLSKMLLDIRSTVASQRRISLYIAAGFGLAVILLWFLLR